MLLGKRLGLIWDATLPLQLSKMPATDIYGGGCLALGVVHLQVGAGATTIQVVQGNEERLIFAFQPHLGLTGNIGVSKKAALDLGVAGGWTPSTTHLQARVGAMGVGDRPISWFSGADFAMTRSIFEEAGYERIVSANRLRLGLRVGAVFGQRPSKP